MVTRDSKNYKVVSFDLDGTITESRQPIEKDISNLICNLSKKVLVIIISGSSFKNLLVQLNTFLDNEDKNVFENILLMPGNGSQTYSYDKRTASWHMSEKVSMPENLKQEIVRVLREMVNSHKFQIPMNSMGVQIEDRQTQISFSALGVDAPLNSKISWDKDQNKRKEIVSFIAPLLPKADIFIAGTTTIDILPKGVTKGIMLEKMLASKGLKKEDLLFIGDALYEGGNDHEVKKEGFDVIQTSGPKQTSEIINNLLVS